jgi:hypothetical protein
MTLMELIQSAVRIETLGATFSSSRSLYLSSSPGQEEQNKEAFQQTFLGCPQFLVSAIRFLCRERDSIIGPVPLDDALSQAHARETTLMLELIQQFDSSLWASSLLKPGSTCTAERNGLINLSQAYKLGALLFGQRVLAALVKNPPDNSGLVFDLLQLLESLRVEQSLFKCALWPILVAGLECRSVAQREFLSECLEKFWIATNCVNVINAAKILQDYWRPENRGEVFPDWIFGIGHSSRAWLFI